MEIHYFFGFIWLNFFIFLIIFKKRLASLEQLNSRKVKKSKSIQFIYYSMHLFNILEKRLLSNKAICASTFQLKNT